MLVIQAAREGTMLILSVSFQFEHMIPESESTTGVGPRIPVLMTTATIEAMVVTTGDNDKLGRNCAGAMLIFLHRSNLNA